MPKRQTVESSRTGRATAKQRVDGQSCLHLKQEMKKGEDGLVAETYYCMTCKKTVLRIYH